MAQLHLIGTLVDVRKETVNPTGSQTFDPFESVTLLVQSAEGSTDFCRVSAGLNVAEAETLKGQELVFGVWPRPYVNKQTDKLGCGFTVHSIIRTPAHV